MTVFTIDHRKYFYLAILLLTLSLLSGCGKTHRLNKISDESDKAQFYLMKARNSGGQQQTNWLLLASETLLSQQRTDKAIAVLSTINNNKLNNLSNQLYHLLMAQSLSITQHNHQALQQYIAIKQPDLLKKYQQIRYFRGYAELLATLLHHYESALKRIALSDLLSDRLEIEENHELLWQTLMQMDNLSIYQNSLNGILVSGWLELANLGKIYAEQPEVLIKKLGQWRAIYSGHPANSHMPIDMARAEAARSYQPDIIALLLPETGSLARTAKHIRNGFLDAIYQIPADQRPRVQFYDSSNTLTEGLEDIQSLYQLALDQGASFVIGPLHRDAVAALAQRETFPVPVLTINRLSDDIFLPQNFFQFGLPIEDEVRQVAIRAWEDGLKRAIVLVPRGTVGERTHIAFSEQFESLGGEVQQVINYSNGKDYSRSVQELLGVDKSIARYRRLQQVLDIPLKHEPRRRQDTDFIFFKASVKQARRIKPFIDFYYAHDLPLYSTSSIYSGKEDPLLDRDLDNVLFCDIPWLLNNVNAGFTKEHKNQLDHLWPSATQNHSARLFALGHDLFTLIPELSKLRNFPHYQKPGLSGMLSVNQLGHIQRQLSWAKFIDGKAIRIANNEPSHHESD